MAGAIGSLLLLDVAAGLLTLAERDKALGHAWHLPAAEPLSTRQLPTSSPRRSGGP
jgi:hypothetical protein